MFWSLEQSQDRFDYIFMSVFVVVNIHCAVIALVLCC